MVKKINGKFVFSEDEEYHLNRLKLMFPKYKSKPETKKVLEDDDVMEALIAKSAYDCLMSKRILSRLERWGVSITGNLTSKIYFIKEKSFNKREKEYYAERKSEGKKQPIDYPDARYFQSFGVIVLSPARHGDRY